MGRRAKFTEDIHQAAAIRALRTAERRGFGLTCAGDMAAEDRGPRATSKAVLTGLTKGETDIRVYVAGGNLLSIELKTEVGVLSKDQKARHERLRDLGFAVSVVKTNHPEDTAKEVMRLVAVAMGYDDEWFFDSLAEEAAKEIIEATGRK